MTDFSTNDNTLDSSRQHSFLASRPQKRAKSNKILCQNTFTSRSLSPKNQRNIIFPTNSLLKDILQSVHEEIPKKAKIPRRIDKIPIIPFTKPLLPQEILNFSSSTVKSPNCLKTNVLCLFNRDLMIYLEKRAENSKIVQEIIAHKDQLVFLHLQTQEQRQLSSIFEEILLKEKDLVCRDLLRLIKIEFDNLIQECHNYISQPLTDKNLRKVERLKFDVDLKPPSFENYIETLLQVYDLELNEKEQFGILRPEKQDFEKILSYYARFSRENQEKKSLAQKLGKKLAEDFNLIFKLKAENVILRKENAQVGDLKEKITKDSGETFLFVQERLNALERRYFEKSLSQVKNVEKREETQIKAVETQGNSQLFQIKMQKVIEINDSLSAENLGLRQYNDILQKKVARLQLQIKKLDLRKEKIMVNKEVEVKYFHENPQNKPVKSLRYLLNYPSMVSQSSNYSYKWTLILINLIYIHKIMQDVLCEYESISPKSLKELILDFFVTRFRSKYLVESFLRDFINNLRKFAQFSQRIKTFCQLANLEIGNNKNPIMEINNEEMFPYNSAKTTILTSRFSAEVFLRLIYQIRFQTNSINSNNFLENVSNLKNSFLSFEEDETLTVETAKNLAPNLASQDGFGGENVLKDFEERFQSILETDLYERITNYNEELMGNANKQILENSTAIRLDFFLKFMLDMICEKRLSEFQQIYTLIKLQKVNKSEMFLSLSDFVGIFHEVYPMNRLVKLIDNGFIELIDELTDENHLNFTFKNMIFGLLESHQRCKSSYFYNKMMSTPGKQWKNNNEISELCKSVFGDWRSELGIIIETYKIFKSALFQSSRNNQKLYVLHEEFVKGITRINKNILQAKIYEGSWLGEDKTAFLNNLEVIWEKLIELLENTLRDYGI